MLDRANRLAEHPEFYNTLTNNCTTNIVRHLMELSSHSILFDVRVVLPGYSDSLAFDLDLIDFNGSLKDAREQFWINERSSPVSEVRDWSRKIRQSQPN